MDVDLGQSKVRAASSRTVRLSGAIQGCLFAEPLSLPVGFAYCDELVSQAQEQALLRQFETLPFKPFEFQGYLGKRRIVSFGWHYDFAAKTLGRSEPIPPFLHALRDQAAAFAGLPPDRLQQVLINEYAPDAGVGWHRDRPMFEDVIGISLASACTLRLRQRTETRWKRASQILAPRSVYLLRGSSRRDWEHSVPPVEQLRYSVTFRNFSAGAPKRNQLERNQLARNRLDHTEITN
jgi:alkylated DNA repair dioxygenase AlkB